MPDVAAIVLAAGRSRRFGGDKLRSPLMLRGVRMPMLAHTLQAWLQVFDQVQVVIRPDAAELPDAVLEALPEADDRVRWLACPQADAGMGHSLAAGVASTSSSCGWLVGLGDMPALPPTVIAEVKREIEAGAALAAPYVDDRRGHPVGFSAFFRGELLALQGDTGARELLRREQHRLKRLPVQDAGILLDIDTSADLSHLTETLR